VIIFRTAAAAGNCSPSTYFVLAKTYPGIYAWLFRGFKHVTHAGGCAQVIFKSRQVPSLPRTKSIPEICICIITAVPVCHALHANNAGGK